MKYSVGFLISASLLVIAVKGDLVAKFKETAVGCVDETGADMDKLIQLANGEDVEVDDKMKCFGACMMKTLGSMSADGVVSKEAAIEHVPDDFSHRDEALAAIENCFHGEGDDHCATAWAVGECMWNNHQSLVKMFA